MHRTFASVVLAMAVSLVGDADGDDRPTSHFRRPELVAIAWHNDAASRRIQAWRPDGELLDGEESSWIADDVHRIQRRQSDVFGQGLLRPLVVVFRIDETAVASQVIQCRVRQEGRPHAFGTGSPSTRHFLTKSTLMTSSDRLPKWPPHLDIEAMIPDGEPEVIKKLDGPPRRPIELARGLEWSVGLTSQVYPGLKGRPGQGSTLLPAANRFEPARSSRRVSVRNQASRRHLDALAIGQDGGRITYGPVDGQRAAR